LHDYIQPGAYFFTACTAGRASLFGDVVGADVRLNGGGDAVLCCWQDLAQHLRGVAPDAFVVMPNHVHGIVVILAEGPRATLGNAVGLFKASAARAFNTWARTAGRRVWQRGYHDLVIRNDAELRKFREFPAEPASLAARPREPGASAW
jgi:REP element-mobilizing transposase RayT